MVKLSKQLPLVALLLAFTVFVGKAAVQALSTSSTTTWSYDPDKGYLPTEAEGYEETPGATEGNCASEEQVCLIEAPDVGGLPDLSQDLIDAIRDMEPHPDVTYGAFSNN